MNCIVCHWLRVVFWVVFFTRYYCPPNAELCTIWLNIYGASLTFSFKIRATMLLACTVSQAFGKYHWLLEFFCTSNAFHLECNNNNNKHRNEPWVYFWTLTVVEQIASPPVLFYHALKKTSKQMSKFPASRLIRFLVCKISNSSYNFGGKYYTTLTSTAHPKNPHVRRGVKQLLTLSYVFEWHL